MRIYSTYHYDRRQVHGNVDKQRFLILLLLVIIGLESVALASLIPRTSIAQLSPQFNAVNTQTFVVPFDQFNQPISNDTEYALSQPNDGSWMITLTSNLTTTDQKPTTEAQVAISPEYPYENLSIPTIIVQERGDGLLRIEYFAQDWPKSYGLVLFNSTSLTSENITLKFVSYAPPVPVNPQLAPRPNGNLTILVGQTVVLSDYPIAWANLASFYVYGLAGSEFTAGEMDITVYKLVPRMP
jgi:hypothetical protein